MFDFEWFFIEHFPIFLKLKTCVAGGGAQTGYTTSPPQYLIT